MVSVVVNHGPFPKLNSVKRFTFLKVCANEISGLSCLASFFVVVSGNQLTEPYRSVS